MTRIVYGEDERLARWSETRIAMSNFTEDAKAIGVERDGEIVGAFIFTNFGPTGCFMNVASDGSWKWLSRSFLVHAFAYPFVQLNYRRVSAVVSELNEPSLRFVQRLGARYEGRMRCAAPGGEDYLMFGMLREECRWLAPRRCAISGHAAHDAADP